MSLTRWACVNRTRAAGENLTRRRHNLTRRPELNAGGEDGLVAAKCRKNGRSDCGEEPEERAVRACGWRDRVNVGWHDCSEKSFETGALGLPNERRVRARGQVGTARMPCSANTKRRSCKASSFLSVVGKFVTSTGPVPAFRFLFGIGR